MKLDLTSDINRGYEIGLNYPRADKLMIIIHWLSFASVVLFAFTNSILRVASYYPSPLSWRVISLPEALATVIIGFFVALLPSLFIGKFRNHYYWRLFITFTLSVFAYLMVFISGGSIEMHFMFFSLIALIAIYGDWRLGWFMLVLVGMHHLILNYFAPTWVFFYGRNDLAIIAHAVPVVVTVVFTTLICNIYRDNVDKIEQLRIDLREINKEIGSGKHNKS